MKNVKVKIELLDAYKPELIPSFAHSEDACFDVFAAKETVIEAGQMALIPSGFKMELPEGWEAQVRPRSGNSLKKNFHVKFGTVDYGYSGEVGIIIHNANSGPITIPFGSKVAQIAIREIPCVELTFEKVESNTERGENGFGSTDKKKV